MDDIVKKAQNGDVEAIEYIFNKYRKYMYFLSIRHPSPEGDYEDAYQEASIGLFIAIKDTKCECGYPFETFAKMCIRHQIANLLRRYHTKKREILKNTIHERKVNLFVEHRNPEDIVMENETITEILSSLSDLEYVVVMLRILGFTISEVAKKIGMSTGGTGHVISRIKSKIIKIKNGQGHEIVKVRNRTLASAMCNARKSFRENTIVFTEEMVQRISSDLSDTEYKVVKLRLEGLSNGEIAKKLNSSKKGVTCAVSRIKRKMQKIKN
jgi:RNA polymerase sporulation-specific sigma factor